MDHPSTVPRRTTRVMDTQHYPSGPGGGCSQIRLGPVGGTRSSICNDWTEAVGDIDALMQNYQSASLSSEYSGISKEHWVSNSAHPTCMNSRCNKRFTLTERRHHCRRCGHLYCAACSAHRRRLNILGHPDPAGRLYKVCRVCFSDPQTVGRCHSLMDEYRSARWALGDEGADPGRSQRCSNGTTPAHVHRSGRKPSLRNRLDAVLACNWLVAGFQQSLHSDDSSTLVKATAGLKGLLQKPKWQLPANNIYERLVPSCRECAAPFGLLLPRHFCAVCGAATCTTCTTRDMIVYIPNGEDKMAAQWAIINIVGCPEREPDVCVYLRVCGPCQSALTELQAADVALQAVDEEVSGSWESIEAIFMRLSSTQAKIDVQLPKYQELIDSLEISPGAAKSLPQSRSNTQILAKAQGDLSDHFSALVMTIQNVKTLRPSTRGQTKLTRNLIKSKIQFYQENMFTFRDLKRRLATFTPLEVLTLIQGIVDKNAINSCYLSVKQLALEVLHLSLKWNLLETTILLLTELEQVVLEELERSVREAREDWEQHVHCVDEFIKMQLTERWLLRVSSELTMQQASAIAWYRAKHVLKQVQLQLSAKSADRSFPRTKAALTDTLRKLEECSHDKT